MSIGLPFLLLPIMVGIFTFLARWLGEQAGYLLGFGCCEEILWRGLYVRLFPRNIWMGILYPSLGFALWHFAPQVIFPAENVIGFVVSTFFLALPYGFIAYKTGSAKWTAVSHSLSGILALSGYLAPGLLKLIE
jgi:hypothetical protein